MQTATKGVFYFTIMENTQVNYEALLNIPDWVNFLAIDANGEMFGYEKRPYHNSPVDASNRSEWYWIEDSSDGEIEMIATIKNYSGDWKTSLIERQKA